VNEKGLLILHNEVANRARIRARRAPSYRTSCAGIRENDANIRWSTLCYLKTLPRLLSNEVVYLWKRFRCFKIRSREVAQGGSTRRIWGNDSLRRTRNCFALSSHALHISSNCSISAFSASSEFSMDSFWWLKNCQILPKFVNKFGGQSGRRLSHELCESSLQESARDTLWVRNMCPSMEHSISSCGVSPCRRVWWGFPTGEFGFHRYHHVLLGEILPDDGNDPRLLFY
jgi:hypothetical protein